MPLVVAPVEAGPAKKKPKRKRSLKQPLPRKTVCLQLKALGKVLVQRTGVGVQHVSVASHRDAHAQGPPWC